MILSNKQSEIDNDWLVEHFGEEFKSVYCGGVNNLSIEWYQLEHNSESMNMMGVKVL